MHTEICEIRHTSMALVLAFAMAVGGLAAACTDTDALGGDEANEENAGENGQNSGENGQNVGENGGNVGQPGSNDGENADNDGENDDNEETAPPCEGLECDQVDCGPDEPVTSLAGTVYIPSGQLPLPNANIYIPNAEVEPFDEGVSCQPCTETLSGSPLVHTTTNHLGEFYLENIPAASQVPLVIQSGKWRRIVTLTTIDECTVNHIDDPNTLRLPTNRDEGDIPKIAVTSGNSDALECLINKVGLDDEEFGIAGSDASVHIYDGGGSHGFADYMHGGADFPSATQWWQDLAGIDQYDIVLFSCNYPSPSISPAGAQALESFANQGGRVFMTDQQKSWLRDGTADFQSVAGWRDFSGPYDRTGYIDTSFPGGEELAEWMGAIGALDGQGGFPAVELWDNIDSINEDVARRWIYTQPGGFEQDAYFDFHAPVGVDGDQQCGRVVYSDLHIASAGNAEPWGQFPDNCNDQNQQLSEQEQALIYMFFDLGRCIIPDDCTPRTCEELGEDCGIHPDGCGSSVDCGECDDQCNTLGQSCTENADCCSNQCGIGMGSDEGECILG